MYFFPTPYTDEILYSVLARYCKQSGHNNWAMNYEDVFTSRSIVSSVELPGNIDILVSNLPNTSKFTSDYFIFNNTIFPYIASFLPKNRAMEIKESMKAGNASKVYTKSGYTSGYMTKNRYFKFCPKCIEEDIQNYGETYWRRLHQITEVYICPIHRSILKQSSVPMRGDSRQSFIAAIPDLDDDIKADSLYTDNTFEKLLWIAENAQSLLNRQFQFQNIEYYKNVYMEELINKGFACPNTMVHQKKLRKAILEFWGDEVLQLLQCPVYLDKKCSWLSSVVRKNGLASQPIKNLILIGFLGIDTNKLLSHHYTEKEHKKIWEERLIELTSKKKSIRQIALALNSTTESVKRNMKKLSIEQYWKDTGGRIHSSGYKNTNEFADRQKRSRKEWANLIEDNPSFSSSKLRENNETLYTWLFRNDKLWLEAHSSEIEKHYEANWEERDREFLPRIKEIVESMLNGKPERISWVIVATRLDKLSLLTNYKNKLPLVKEYMESKIETLEEFHLRKLRWAINELNMENEPITKSRLMIKAGIKDRYMKNIYEEVSQLLKSMGYDGL